MIVATPSTADAIERCRGQRSCWSLQLCKMGVMYSLIGMERPISSSKHDVCLLRELLKYATDKDAVATDDYLSYICAVVRRTVAPRCFARPITIRISPIVLKVHSNMLKRRIRFNVSKGRIAVVQSSQIRSSAA